MSEKALKALAFLVGCLMAVMVLFNAKLQEATTPEAGLIANQVTGLVLISSVLILFQKHPSVRVKSGRVPWPYRFGGLFGLVIILLQYYALEGTGATVSMAAMVLGQCIAGFVLDQTGFLGMRKRKVTGKKLLSLSVSAIGIALMLLFSGEECSLFALLAAVLSGILSMTQMTYNSHVAEIKGPFFSGLLNAISGCLGIFLFAFLIKHDSTVSGLALMSHVPFALVIAGGFIGTIILILANTLIQKIPGTVSSILMSAGQILAGLPLDLILLHRAYPSLVFGALIMILGLTLDR